MGNRRFAPVLACLLLTSCSQDAGVQDQVDLWQGEMPVDAPWLRERLPENTLVYLRVPNLLGFVAMPKGNALDPALRSKANIENVQAIHQGVVDNILPLLPAAGEAHMRLFAGHLRSPVELAATFLPAPATIVAATLDIRSVEEFEGLLADLGIGLVAPLDAAGTAELSGLPVQARVSFDAASGRVLVHGGPGATPQAFAALLEGVAARPVRHAMHELEHRIDESGQGYFLWVSGSESIPLLRMFVPRDAFENLLDMGLESVSGLAMGWGASRGKGRLALVANLLPGSDRGFLPYVENTLSARSVGAPDSLLLLSLPTVEEFQRLEALALQSLSAAAAAQWEQGKAAMLEAVGVSIEDILDAVGPELLLIFDRAGDYAAIRIRDAGRFDHVIAEIAGNTGTAPDQREIAGRVYRHWSVPGLFVPADEDSAEQAAWVTELLGRVRDHYYWTHDGDFAYFAGIPQVLLDRASLGPDTDVGEWLRSTQRIDAGNAFVALSSTSRKLPGGLYAFYIEMLQLLGDLSRADIDVWAMPTAAQLQLPDRGAFGFSMSLGDPTIGMELTFENNPAEALGGASGIAVVGILAAIAIPAYADYTTRAQVSEGLSLSSGAKAAVTEYYRDNGRFPDRAAVVELQAILRGGRYTESVTVEPDSGVIVIVYTPEVSGGGEVWLEPAAASDGSVTWTCRGTFQPKHLPPACRP